MSQAKNSKKKSGGSPQNYSEVYKKSAATVTAPIVAADGSATAAAAVVQGTGDEVDWKGEYGYVINDLKRLGIVTAIIAGGIIVVGLFV